MGEPVKVSIDGAVGRITLSNPEKFNCLSMDVWTRIDEARREFESNGAVRVILLDAEGKHFCTGANLEEVKRVKQDSAELDKFIGLGLAALDGLEASSLPFVIAVQGLCLAGGLELMLGGDVLFAAKSAQFGDQHSQFGLVPGWGGSQRLTRLIGLRRALDLYYSARWISADDAASIGLVNYVVEDEKLLEDALAYCKMLSEKSREGLGHMKVLARQGLDMPLADSLEFERRIATPYLTSEDVAEGLEAFEARRKPNFKT